MSSPEIGEVRQRLIATPGQPFQLSSRDSADRDLFPDKKHARKQLQADAGAIDELQDLLYACRQRALLVG